MTIPANPELYILTREDGRKVFHLGNLGPLPADEDRTKPFNLGPYTDGVFNVPNHWWISRWTDRTNCPITIKRSPAQIVAANRMFPYGDTGCKVPTPGPRVHYTLMGSSNITIYMGTTGERPDIGLITDNSAYYMLGGDPAPMLDWAQSAESCPMHLRDESTDRPVDLIKYPATNAYSEPNKQGSPNLVLGPLVADSNGNKWPTPGGGWGPQQAHYCEMSYLAHVATLDMGFLEDLQYSANFTVLADGYVSNGRKIATVSGELRGISWAFRNLFMAHAATKDAEAAGTLPAACHPSAYWQTILDNQLAYYTATFMNDPANQLFRLVSGGNRFASWQCDYMLSALAFGVLTGHSDWVPLYLWALKNVIDRTSGKSGYPVGWGGAYYLNTCEWGKNADGTYNQGIFDASKPLDWYGTFLFQVNDPNGAQPTPAQIAALKADQFNAATGYKPFVGAEYLMTTRAVLVMAQYLHKLGLVDVKAAYPDLDLCFANVDRMVRANGSMNPRVSVISTGGIIMPTAVSITLGQKVHLDVGFTGPKPPAPPAYTQSDATVGSLSAGDMAGVLFSSIAVGKTTVTAATIGVSGAISATCEVTVTSPLPTGITLTPGAVS